MQADIALQCHYTDNTQLLELSDHIRDYLKRKKSDSWEQDISEKEMPIYHSALDQLNVSLQWNHIQTFYTSGQYAYLGTTSSWVPSFFICPA